VGKLRTFAQEAIIALMRGHNVGWKIAYRM
jgi:hypothetical protein